MRKETFSVLRRTGAWCLALFTSRRNGTKVQCSLWVMAICYIGFRIAWLNDFMVHVDDFVPIAETIRQGMNPFSFSDVTRLSSFYTYPPGQFFLSLPLAFSAPDFPTALLLFRLPSFALWLIGLAVLWRVLRALWPEQPASHAGLIVLLAVCSWRGFIESSQGYNYASTLLVTATLAWFTVTPRGRAWLCNGPLAAFGSGVLLGLFSWLTYQAAFISFAALGAYFIGALLRRDWHRLWLSLVTVLGFAGPFGWVAWNCLRHVLSFASGTPGWAPGLPGNTPGTRLLFPFHAWFDVLQANLTFLPWGRGSIAIAALAALLIITGLVRTLANGETRRQMQPLLWLVASVFVVFTAGPFLRQFPLGPTRHTFVLQVPVLLTVALGLSAWRLPRIALTTLSVAVAMTAACFVPTLLRHTTNHVDYALIQHYFRSDPQARIVDLPSSFTWEITYLARESQANMERIRWNNQFASVNELAAFLAAAPRGYLVSHRGPMNDATRAALHAVGFTRITTLAAVEPQGSTELAGNLNGGNGFFFYAVER